MKQFTKKYQVWSTTGDRYGFKEFDTLQECITSEKTGDWYITKRVSLSVQDAEEQTNVRIQHQSLGGAIPLGEVKPIEPDPAEDLAAKYAAGPVGPITTE